MTMATQVLILCVVVGSSMAFAEPHEPITEVTHKDRVYRYVGDPNKIDRVVFPSNSIDDLSNESPSTTVPTTLADHHPKSETDNKPPAALDQLPDNLGILMKDLMGDQKKFLSAFVDTSVDESNVDDDKKVQLSYITRGYAGSTETGPGKRPFKMPKISAPAACAVEMRTVELTGEHMKQSEIYYPWCVRLPRCSGCCPSRRLECVATNVSYIDVTAVRLRYANFNQKFRFEGVQVFKMMKHEACQCQCVQQPEDCNIEQDYRPEECRCVCRDSTAAAVCRTRTDKVWKADSCECECKVRTSCSTGLYFSSDSCRCEVNHDLKKKRLASNATEDNYAVTNSSMDNSTAFAPENR